MIRLNWFTIAISAFFALTPKLCADPPTTRPASRPASHPVTAPASSKPASEPDRSSEVTTPEITPESLQKTMKDIEDATGLDESLKSELLAVYQQALQDINRAQELAARAADFTLRIHNAPEDLTEVRADLEQPLPDLEASITAESQPTEAQQTANEADAELNERQSKLAELEQEQVNRADRRRIIPELLSAAQQKLEENREPEGAKSGEPGALQEARRIARHAREAALRDEISALQAESSAYDARAEILIGRRDLAAREVAQQKKLVTALRAVMQDVRRIEKEHAEQDAQQAKEQAGRAHPAIAPLLTENANLADEKRKLGEQLEQIAIDAEKTKTDLGARISESQRLRKILSTVGQTSELGAVLRAAQAKLPNVRGYERDLRRDEKAIAAAQIREFELSRESSSLAVLDDEIDAVLAQLDPATDPDTRARIAAVAREQLRVRKKSADELQLAQGRLIQELSNLNQDRRALINETNGLNDVIGENVLWIQSLPALGPQDVGLVRTSLAHLTQPKPWRDLLVALGQWLSRNAVSAAAAGLLLISLICIQPWLRSDLRSIRERVGRASTDAFHETLRAALWTVLLAAPGPLALLLLREAILRSQNVNDYQHALGVALQRSAQTWFALGCLWHLARRNGLGEAHFRLRPEVVAVLRRVGFWMLVLVPPIVAVSVFLSLTPEELGLKPLGRLAIMLRSALMTGFMAYLLRPSGPILDRYLDQTRGGWIDRLRYIWYPLIILMPLSLLLMAAFGYYYTAGQIETRTQSTWLLLLSLVVAHLLITRWLLVAAKRLALDKAGSQAKRAAPAAAAAPPEAAPVAEEKELTAGEVSAQARQLLRTVIGVVFVLGVWWTWADTLPALRFLENYRLYDGGAPAAVAASDTKSDTAAPPAPTGVISKPITLADVMVAAVALIFTIMLAKNIPGVLEITILQRLPLEPSARYAISTICSYVITIVGLAISFSALGIGWSKVQWLAAAVTFGLGFGLQEIFANFVSGLILLFERPIRLGDTVTVGDVSGTVTRIRIRATTITDADRRDLIVPNKEFIVGKFINWTLTDDTLRVVIPVGVAYGADIEKVRSILLRAAREHPDVNHEPPPRAFFLGFTENALKFELRVFVAGPGDSTNVQHDINAILYREFQKAGVHLAHPLREIRVHTVDSRTPAIPPVLATPPIPPPAAPPPTTVRH